MTINNNYKKKKNGFREFQPNLNQRCLYLRTPLSWKRENGEANPKVIRAPKAEENEHSQSNTSGNAIDVEPFEVMIKHHGEDILKKSPGKNMLLFSFPFLRSPCRHWRQDRQAQGLVRRVCGMVRSGQSDKNV